MSRGQGRIERTILRTRHAAPEQAFTAADMPGACRAAAFARCGSNSVAGADGNGGALDPLMPSFRQPPRSR
jgi:hypothetical protein